MQCHLLLLLLLHSSSSLVTHGTALKWQTTFGSCLAQLLESEKCFAAAEQAEAKSSSGATAARTCHCTIIGFRNISRIFNKKTENRWNASNTHNIKTQCPLPVGSGSLNQLCLAWSSQFLVKSLARLALCLSVWMSGWVCVGVCVRAVSPPPQFVPMHFLDRRLRSKTILKCQLNFLLLLKFYCLANDSRDQIAFCKCLAHWKLA